MHLRLLTLLRNFREVSELVGLRLLEIKPATVARFWHAALLGLYRYCCLQRI